MNNLNIVEIIKFKTIHYSESEKWLFLPLTRSPAPRQLSGLRSIELERRFSFLARFFFIFIRPAPLSVSLSRQRFPFGAKTKEETL